MLLIQNAHTARAGSPPHKAEAEKTLDECLSEPPIWSPAEKKNDFLSGIFIAPAHLYRHVLSSWWPLWKAGFKKTKLYKSSYAELNSIEIQGKPSRTPVPVECDVMKHGDGSIIL